MLGHYSIQEQAGGLRAGHGDLYAGGEVSKL